MLLGLLALVPSLLVSPPAGGGDQLSRRVLLRGAAASVLTVSAAANAEDFGGEFAKQGLGFQERPSSLGSAGISAYQQLKLQTALPLLRRRPARTRIAVGQHVVFAAASWAVRQGAG